MMTFQNRSRGMKMDTPAIMAMEKAKAKVVNWELVAQLTTRLMASCIQSRTSLVAAHVGHSQQIQQQKVPLLEKQILRQYTSLSSIL